MYTRDAFERQRAVVRRLAAREGRVLAAVSVGLGIAQLLFLRWADVHLARGPKLAIAGSAFVVYILLVGALFWRMERRLRAARPRCPHCGRPLKDMSERVATATGRCDTCGGQVLE